MAVFLRRCSQRALPPVGVAFAAAPASRAPAIAHLLSASCAVAPMVGKRAFTTFATPLAQYPGPLLAAAAFGAVVATGFIFLAERVCGMRLVKVTPEDVTQAFLAARFAALPDRIILVRHGESEGNADHTLYRTKADNLIELTETGSRQAVEAGKRIKRIIGNATVYMHVSPFERTLQTSRNIRLALDPEQILGVHVTSNIREQEFGNLQGDGFKQLRAAQQKVGRFWFRFPTGESGADVYDRTKHWWHEVLRINERPGYARAECVLVVTHGLTMRFILMQLFEWSPNTFHTVWNAGNCEMYVLRKTAASKGRSPYELDSTEGDMPVSTIDLCVTLKSGEKRHVHLKDFLSVPSPRTTQFDVVCQMLYAQHGIEPLEVTDIDFFGGKFKKFR